MKCQSCNAISVFEPSRVAQRCEFCGSPSIVPYQETRDAITPESLLPVKLDAPRVRDIVKSWVHSRWFAPERSEIRRADGHAESDLSSLLDLRRFSPCRLDCNVRRLLLHDRILHGREGPASDPAGAACALVSELRKP